MIPPKVQSPTFTSVMWPLASQALSSLQVLVPLCYSRGVVEYSGKWLAWTPPDQCTAAPN